MTQVHIYVRSFKPIPSIGKMRHSTKAEYCAEKQLKSQKNPPDTECKITTTLLEILRNIQTL